jgi:hypothetical protein
VCRLHASTDTCYSRRARGERRDRSTARYYGESTLKETLEVDVTAGRRERESGEGGEAGRIRGVRSRGEYLFAHSPQTRHLHGDGHPSCHPGTRHLHGNCQAPCSRFLIGCCHINGHC